MFTMIANAVMGAALAVTMVGQPAGDTSSIVWTEENVQELAFVQVDDGYEYFVVMDSGHLGYKLHYSNW